MIAISTDSRTFFNNEDENAVLIFYGAGIKSEILADLIKKTNIKIECFIDRDITKKDHYFNGIKIYTANQVQELYKHKNIKIFVTIIDTASALLEIETNIKNAEVFIPIEEVDQRSINLAIAPLRKKLLKSENFSVITNTCIGTRIYQLLDSKYQSPTSSVIIKPNDFYKLCADLKNYMSENLEFVRYEEWKYPGKYHTLCRLKDIEIKFIGKQNYDTVKSNWERRVERINYENLFFLWEDTHYAVSKDLYDKFLAISPGKKLILQSNAFLSVEHSIFVNNSNIYSPNVLVESWLQLTDFINKEIEY